MRLARTLIVLLLVIFIATGAVARGEGAKQASAVLRDSAGKVVGTARFTEDERGLVRVDVSVEGLPPGPHGIHIHEKGNCSPEFGAAGAHYNPLGKQHGLLNPKGPHAGDLPDIVVDRSGVGRLNVTTGLVTLSPGPTTLLDSDGSAIVIHAGPDDQVTDPAGHSGDRIACGVIEGG